MKFSSKTSPALAQSQWLHIDSTKPFFSLDIYYNPTEYIRSVAVKHSFHCI